ncbi:MAG TPA: metal ABC transporter ATP-binding protein [candidate division Zixibacteria bacterium]|nr:metal ABC transporter ATP-binding protein [candidate division Zixibacteria bacterium]
MSGKSNNVVKEIDTIKETNKPIICLHDVVVAYQSNVAIFDINLDIYRNEFVGICGPNGSGKSTLLKSIIGAVEPLKGSVKILGEEVSKSGNLHGLRKKFGYLPQMSDIDRNFPALVKDVVGMGLYSKIGLFRNLNKSDYEKIRQALEIVELEQYGDRPIGHLSGGQQQKVMIARGIVNNPDILFLDEPTSALDFKVARNIMNLIKKIHDETDLTIILVSHDIDFIKNNCSRALCMNRRIVWDGNPKDREFEQIVNNVFLK